MTAAIFASQQPAFRGGGVPAWVRPGALVDLDMANERYWITGTGLVDVEDALEENLDTGATFSPSDIVSTIGLTTGAVGGATGANIGPVLTAAAFSAAYNNGFCAVIEYSVTSTGAIPGDGYVSVFLTATNLPAYNTSFVIGPYIAAGGQSIYTQALETTADEAAAGAFNKVATNADATTGDIILSYLGAAVPAAAEVGDYSAIDSVWLGLTIVKSGGNFTGTATISRATFYPPMDQTELNALTAP